MAERLAASRSRQTARPTKIGDAGRSAAGDYEEQQGLLGSRLLAFFIDSVVLTIFAIAFVGVASLNLLLQTDGGFTDVSDAAMWQFVYISCAAVPAWFVATFILLTRRGQTVGQYIVGLFIVRADGSNASAPQVLLYLLALHPLLFHPVLGLFWALAALTSISAVSNDLVLFALGAATILSIASPAIAFVSASADRGRRALHDRIAGTTVVRLG